MTRAKTSLAVGIFVLIGLGLILGAIVWLGLSIRMEEGSYYAAYFDESVQGLANDSAVKYRGVSVGRVKSIEMAPDATLIQVILKLDPGLTPDADMVARLKSVGITGIMYVELDRRDPESPDVSPRLTFPSNYPVIATRASEISRFMSEINAMLEHIRTLDLKAISTSITETLTEIRLAVAGVDADAISADLRQALQRMSAVLSPEDWNRLIVTFEKTALAFKAFSTSADQAVGSIDRTAGRFDTLLAKNDPEVTKAVSELNHAATAALKLLENGNRLIVRADITLADLKRQLMLTLQHMERASDNLKATTETVSEQPSQLIFANPRPARIIETETLP